MSSPSLDLALLNNFLTVANEGSISAAARKLMIAQPALSKQMQKLEAEFGCMLLVRGRKITLTDAGRALKESALSLKIMENSVRATMSQFSGEMDQLRLACTPHNASVFLDGVLTPFLQKHPDIHLEMYEKSTTDILTLMKEGEAEIGIVNDLPSDTRGFTVHCHISDPLVAVWHPDFKFDIGDGLEIKRLKGVDVALIRSLNDRISGYCAAEGFIPNIVCVSSQLSTSLLMAIKNKAVAIVPYSAMRKYSDLRFSFFKESFMTFPTNLVSYSETVGNAARDLIAIFRDTVKDSLLLNVYQSFFN